MRDAHQLDGAGTSDYYTRNAWRNWCDYFRQVIEVMKQRFFMPLISRSLFHGYLIPARAKMLRADRVRICHLLAEKPVVLDGAPAADMTSLRGDTSAFATCDRRNRRE
jgi:hypothetical protein